MKTRCFVIYRIRYELKFAPKGYCIRIQKEKEEETEDGDDKIVNYDWSSAMSFDDNSVWGDDHITYSHHHHRGFVQ